MSQLPIPYYLDFKGSELEAVQLPGSVLKSMEAFFFFFGSYNSECYWHEEFQKAK